MSAAVDLDNISVRFGGRWAIIRLSMSIPRGTSVMLTGDNGAGKTTLLRVIATALSPTRGALSLFGTPVSGDLERARRCLAFVGHQSHFYEAMTAREALSLVADLAGRPEQDLGAILAQVRLDKDAARPIQQFSAGMKRRLTLARLLVQEPQLALLDEPFTALDPAGVEMVGDIVKKLHERGVTFIIASHDHERTRPMCTHTFVMGGGELREPLRPLARSGES